MAALFGHGNPLTTPVGQLIERATDGTQPSENWGLYMEVCDVINETDEGPKDAIKAVRKRLTQNMGKNHTAILYTLTCLETCVKNCGRRFHIQVANKDFLNDMVKVIGPKYDPPQVVQEKVLSLIQTWADAFRGTPDLKDVEKVYQDLKAKGIEFPMTDLDHLAPIHTPARTQGSDPEPPVINRTRGSTTNRSSAYVVEDEEDYEAPVHSPGSVLPPPQAVIPPQQMVPPPATGGLVPTQEMLAKLRSELDVVQGNVRVMSEMLTELTPSDVDSSDLELLQELNRTNRQMQQRIVELLEGVPNEEVTNELLRVNDDLNNVFLRYERFERYRTGQTGQGGQEPSTEPAPTESLAPPSYNDSVQTTNPKVADLIDLGGDTSTVTNQMAQMSPYNADGMADGVSPDYSLLLEQSDVDVSGGPAPAPAPAQSDDFDMFAQSRKSFDQNKENMSSGNGYVNESDRYGQTLGQAVNVKAQPDAAKSNDDDEILQATRKLQDKESDYDEMERWLQTQEEANQAGGANQGEPITSSEFDSFLQDRASAASALPTISAQTGTQPNRRQLQKDDEDNPLFAL